MIASRRFQTRRRALRASAVLIVGALALAACGRKGAPEFDTGEPIVKSDTNTIVPGLNLPQKAATTPKPKQPKGNFILDPLL